MQPLTTVQITRVSMARVPIIATLEVTRTITATVTPG
jgi:hypothetical protein